MYPISLVDETGLMDRHVKTHVVNLAECRQQYDRKDGLEAVAAFCRMELNAVVDVYASLKDGKNVVTVKLAEGHDPVNPPHPLAESLHQLVQVAIELRLQLAADLHPVAFRYELQQIAEALDTASLNSAVINHRIQHSPKAQ